MHAVRHVDVCGRWCRWQDCHAHDMYARDSRSSIILVKALTRLDGMFRSGFPELDGLIGSYAPALDGLFRSYIPA